MKIRVDGGAETKIHTSCSKPFGPGLVFGDFTVVEAFSKDGTAICEVTDGGGDDELCALGKPEVLIVEFTGDDCLVTNNIQAADKVSCADFGPLSSGVRILITDKEDAADSRAKVWFDAVVSVGDQIGIDATNAGEARLKANTWVHLYASDATLLQLINFHTSCSQPLRVGDRFGSLTVVDLIPQV